VQLGIEIGVMAMVKRLQQICTEDKMIRLQTISVAVRTAIGRYCADESGTTAIEYAMIAAGVGLCVSSTVWKLGTTLKTTFYDKLASVLP